jgi:hypothetical protein
MLLLDCTFIDCACVMVVFVVCLGVKSSESSGLPAASGGSYGGDAVAWVRSAPRWTVACFEGGSRDSFLAVCRQVVIGYGDFRHGE